MKVKSRIILALLVCAVALTYTACKKTSAVSKSTVDSKTVSKQIALNLAQTLYGGLGGFDLSAGLNAPNGDAVITRQKLTLKHQQMALKLSHGRQINDTGDDILCGLSEDTTVNYSSTLDDGSTASVTGSIGYTFLCTNSIFSGFNVRDNLAIGSSNSSLTLTYKINENLTVQAKTPGDDNSNYTLGGTVGFSDNIAYKTGSKATTSESYNYNFTTPLLIDSSGTIDSGTATFATKGSNSSGNWDYSGTIEFLGGYNVKITINGATYNVNIQTGAVS